MPPSTKPYLPATLSIRLLLLCLLILGAYALRIANIDTYSYWQDEAAQIDAAMAPDLIGVARTVSARGIGGVPLDHMLTWVVLRIAGDTEIVLRYLPLMWSVITVALSFRLGEALQPGVGKWSALAMALSPLAVAYAREARFYSLGLMLATAVITLGALVARGQLRMSARVWLLCFGLAAATVYAHVYSALLWAAGAAIVVFGSPQSRRLRVAVWFVTALVCAGVVFLPWLLWAMNTAPHGLGADSLGERQINAVLRGLELPPILPMVRADWLARLYPFVAAVLTLLGILSGLRSRPHRWLVAGLTLAGLFGAAAVTVANLAAHYFFAPRQFLFLATLRALLIGFGLWQIGRIAPRLLSHAPIPALVRAAVTGVFIASAVQVSRLDLYAPSVSVAGPAVKFVLQHYNPQTQDIWLSGIVRFAVDFYVRRSGAPPIPWRTDITLESFKAARPHSIAVVELRLTSTATYTLESAGFRPIWPSPDQFERYDLVIYIKSAGESR